MTKNILRSDDRESNSARRREGKEDSEQDRQQDHTQGRQKRDGGR